MLREIKTLEMMQFVRRYLIDTETEEEAIKGIFTGVVGAPGHEEAIEMADEEEIEVDLPILEISSIDGRSTYLPQDMPACIERLDTRLLLVALKDE